MARRMIRRQFRQWTAAGVAGIVWVAALTGAPAAQAAGAADAAASVPAPDADRPSAPREASAEAEALDQARRTGEAVEVTALRGETREVFATPDGTLEAREYLRPVWARQNGTWERVDLGLEARPDGTAGPRVSTVELSFSGGGDDPLVRMVRSGRELAMSWPEELPAPALDGPAATYPEVLPGVDLRMTAVPDGFISLLVVKTPSAARNPRLGELRLDLETVGLDIDVSASGELTAVDEGAGGVVFTAPQPLMWDSGEAANPGTPGTDSTAPGPRERLGAPGVATPATEPDPATGPTESSRVAALGVGLSGDDQALLLTPDPRLLTGADTRYPVYIDPQWHSPRASAWAMVSKTYPGTSYWKFNGKNDEGLGTCSGWYGCPSGEVKRLFYRIDTSRFAGTNVLSAEFVVRNVHSAQCTDHPVQLWRTKGISSSTTWNTQNASGFWAERLRTESFHYGGAQDSCQPAGDAEFPITSAIQTAADQGRSTLTFGLRASDESSRYHWKRFADDAHLRVRYNRPPAQPAMSQLTMEYGGTCKPPAEAAGVRTLGRIQASGVTDPDGDDLRVRFQVKQGSTVLWASDLSTAKQSGSTFSVQLPDDLPEGAVLHWHVQAYDGHDYGPWSSAGSPTACYFTYDTSVPEAPALDSAQYPASDPADPDDPWHDGVGRHGTFTVSAGDPDVTRYRYGVNSDPLPGNEVATTEGAPAAFTVLPDRPGLHFVTAQALDGAGNASEVRTYQFRVGNGPGPRSTWALDEPAGATEFAATAAERPAQLTGGAQTGATGTVGTALHLDGSTGYAATERSAVDTSGIFTISAWARLDEKPSGAAVVAAQAGRHRPGFQLYYSAANDSWAFAQYLSDTPGQNYAGLVTATGVPVAAGEWTHLLASYDGSTLRLYVDGELAGSTPYDDAWDARGPVTLGAGRYGTTTSAFFPGTLDEVQIFAGFLRGSDPDIARLHNKERIREAPGRPAAALFDLDEPAGATEVSGAPDVVSAGISGGVQPGVDGITGSAARFDGTDGYAATTAGAVRTDRSFAVSAWARLDKSEADTAGIVATQVASVRPGFELYYSKHYDRWAFNQYSADDADSSPVRALQPAGSTARDGEWTHLVGVHDAESDTLTLYVNGRAVDTTPHVAWHANGPIQIGAGRYGSTTSAFFSGDIADVRVYDRVVTGYEVGQLFQRTPLVKGRWMFEEGTAETPDASAGQNPLQLGSGAGLGHGWVDSGALTLDGVTGHAQTATVPVDTSGSFTVTGWAQAAAVPDGDVALVSAAGTRQSAFSVRFVPDPAEPGWGSWQIALAEDDTDTAPVTRVGNRLFYDVRDWTHLAVVYDGFAKEVRLYVNGELEQTADSASWAAHVLTFQAADSLQVGRARTGGTWGEHWPGAVDDLWLFQGVLNSAQVRQLAVGQPGMPTEVPGQS